MMAYRAETAQVLIVRLHPGASSLADKTAAGFLEVLNESETCCPGTALTLTSGDDVPLFRPRGGDCKVHEAAARRINDELGVR